MTSRALRALPLALGLALVTHAAPALAQEPLDGAEAALAQVDFPEVRRLAQEAIESGQLGPERLARAYELLGLASAAEGELEAARDAYIRLLALAPDADPTRDLAPRLRSPFLEARGFWTSRRDRLSLEVTMLEGAGQLRVQLSDPVHLGARMEVGVRPLGSDAEFATRSSDSPSTLQVPLGEGDRFEVYVAVYDTHGNRVIERGTRGAPEIVGEARAVGGDGGGGGEVSGGGDDTGLIVLGVVLGVLAAGGIATAIAVPIATNTRTLAPEIRVGF